MTMTAERVLTDARRVSQKLEDEDDETEFRILWVAAVTLTRAVGHVLHKIDAEQYPELRPLLASKLQTCKAGIGDDAIYMGSIEDERNSVIKTYEFGFHDGPTQIVALLGNEPADEVTLPPAVYRPMVDGVFAGDDCRDVLAQALDWWEVFLRSLVAMRAIQGVKAHD